MSIQQGRAVKLLSDDSANAIVVSLTMRLEHLEAIAETQVATFGKTTTLSSEYLAGARMMLAGVEQALTEALARSEIASTDERRRA